jgi:hypothetical protein
VLNHHSRINDKCYKRHKIYADKRDESAFSILFGGKAALAGGISATVCESSATVCEDASLSNGDSMPFDVLGGMLNGHEK